MKSPLFTAKIAVEQGAGIYDKLTKNSSKTNHPAISVFFFRRLRRGPPFLFTEAILLSFRPEQCGALRSGEIWVRCLINLTGITISIINQ